MLNGKPKLIKKENHSVVSIKKHSVIVSLSATEFRQASIAAEDSKQTVAEWIADMVYTTTQP